MNTLSLNYSVNWKLAALLQSIFMNYFKMFINILNN